MTYITYVDICYIIKCLWNDFWRK